MTGGSFYRGVNLVRADEDRSVFWLVSDHPTYELLRTQPVKSRGASRRSRSPADRRMPLQLLLGPTRRKPLHRLSPAEVGDLPTRLTGAFA